MLSTTLTAMSRLVLLTVSRPPPIGMMEGQTSYLPLSWPDDSGTLHRWITCDAFDAEVLAREAHSWHVLGDMVMCDAPLMLHAVEIGQQRAGRRHSPWARCYKHPVIAGQFRFQRPDGRGGWRKLSGDQWKPVWYADQTRPDPEAWCDLMDADHVTQSLLHHISIAQPSAAQARRIRGEILQVAGEMERAARLSPLPESPMAVPMARSACDPVWGPCPWQHGCFAEEYSQSVLAATGLYQIRGTDASGSSYRLPQVHRDGATNVVA
jgi:hypothetical protein